VIHLFYAEPDLDRWLPGDRWPRRIVRRLVREPAQPGGMERYFLNLRAGLDLLGVPYRVNDYRSLRRNPGALAAVVGKHLVVDAISPDHPVVFGPAVPAHPLEQPELFARPTLRLTLVSCDWLAAMYRAAGVENVAVWAAGIDTAGWAPLPKSPPAGRRLRVLVYDKIRWERAALERDLLAPVLAGLARQNCAVETIRYGRYREDDYRAALGRSDAMVFLCEHETQGFAYLQALSAGVPLLAWDRGGPWRDPAFHPQRVQFGPVTSVPYWDGRCGVRFADATAFPAALEQWREARAAGRLDPRAYVEDHLGLAACARRYLELVTESGLFTEGNEGNTA